MELNNSQPQQSITKPTQIQIANEERMRRK